MPKRRKQIAKAYARAFTTQELRNGLYMRCYKKMLREVLKREVPPGVPIQVLSRKQGHIRIFEFRWLEDL